MEEKVLIRSDRYNTKKLFVIICLVGLFVGLIAAAIYYGPNILAYSKQIQTSLNAETWKELRAGMLEEAMVVTAVCFFTAAIIGAILFFAWSSIELVVSDKRVYGCAAFGKRVDLPIDSVSAIGSKWPKGITVATSSGKIDFLMIKNRDEIHKCVSNLLIERQSKPVATPAPAPVFKQEVPLSNADELKKYKELLDMGIISQEEFDAKKKQLLGL